MASAAYNRSGVDDTALELYLNAANRDELRHAAICVLHRLGELPAFDMSLYAYPEGDIARIGAERMARAVYPVIVRAPELVS